MVAIDATELEPFGPLDLDGVYRLAESCSEGARQLASNPDAELTVRLLQVKSGAMNQARAARLIAVFTRAWLYREAGLLANVYLRSSYRLQPPSTDMDYWRFGFRLGEAVKVARDKPPFDLTGCDNLLNLRLRELMMWPLQEADAAWADLEQDFERNSQVILAARKEREKLDVYP